MSDAEESRRAFTALYRATGPTVRGYLGRRADPETADDLAAQTYESAWTHLDAVLDHPRPVAWLLLTARHHLANHARSGWVRHAATRSDSRSQVAGVPDLADGADAADVALARIGAERALTALADGDRELLLLSAWDGLATATIAAVLQIPQGTCAVRLVRARNRYRAAFAASCAVTEVAARESATAATATSSGRHRKESRTSR